MNIVMNRNIKWKNKESIKCINITLTEIGNIWKGEKEEVFAKWSQTLSRQNERAELIKAHREKNFLNKIKGQQKMSVIQIQELKLQRNVLKNCNCQLKERWKMLKT
jgi:hypothetical protein